MPLLSPQVQAQVRAALAEMQSPVTLLMFTQGEGGAIECEFCGETRQRRWRAARCGRYLAEATGSGGRITSGRRAKATRSAAASTTLSCNV